MNSHLTWEEIEMINTHMKMFTIWIKTWRLKLGFIEFILFPKNIKDPRHQDWP
jgi:hypothetical protein